MLADTFMVQAIFQGKLKAVLKASGYNSVHMLRARGSTSPCQVGLWFGSKDPVQRLSARPDSPPTNMAWFRISPEQSEYPSTHRCLREGLHNSQARRDCSGADPCHGRPRPGCSRASGRAFGCSAVRPCPALRLRHTTGTQCAAPRPNATGQQAVRNLPSKTEG